MCKNMSCCFIGAEMIIAKDSLKLEGATLTVQKVTQRELDSVTSGNVNQNEGLVKVK